ncbi:MAG: HAD-IA family hydrolase [Rhodospirillales bacterium]|jgi:phosphoglycolate phosphatase|nr:HAD-IA family hydrolase [Rhodospirillales bacterium]
MEKLRLAVFDCDGTLVDSQQAIVRTMTATFEAHTIEPPEPSSIRRIIGLPLAQAIECLLPEGSLNNSADMVDTYKHMFYDQCVAGNVEEPLFPGVVDVLDLLTNDGWLLGIATGKAMRGLKATLEPYGLLDYFVTLQTSDVALGKPNPDMLHRAMENTGVDAVNTVMIGDTTFDIDMACNAGTKGIGVSWGYHEAKELHQSGASCVIDTFEALPKALEHLTENIR